MMWLMPIKVMALFMLLALYNDVDDVYDADDEENEEQEDKAEQEEEEDCWMIMRRKSRYCEQLSIIPCLNINFFTWITLLIAPLVSN